jgi:hypothetical protein
MKNLIYKFGLWIQKGSAPKSIRILVYILWVVALLLPMLFAELILVLCEYSINTKNAIKEIE